MSITTILRWKAIPPIAGMPAVGAKRYQHVYLIVTSHEGASASYNDHSLDRTHTRFIADSAREPFASVRQAQAACEADLRHLLRRRQ